MKPPPWTTGPPDVGGRSATLAGVQLLTSDTSPLEVGWVPLPAPCAGALGMTLAPGRRGASFDGRTLYRRNLGTDLLRLRDHHRARRLVCCMEPREMEAHAVATLPARAVALDLRVHLLPIPDGSIPADEHALEDLLTELRAAVLRERIVVHCLGGLGRSGLVAGCLLVELGVPIGDVLTALGAARGPRCPETLAQRDFVRRWAARRRPS